MKEKILQGLKNEYANLGLSNEVLNGAASILQRTITKEEDIETAIKDASVSSFLKGLQSDFDRIRGEKTQLANELKALKEKQIPVEPKPTEPNDNDDVAKLAKEVAEMKAELAKANAEKLKLQIKNGVAELMKQKGCESEAVRDIVLGNLTIADDATIDSVDTIAEDGIKAYGELSKKLYGDGGVPPVGNAPQKVGYQKGEFNGLIQELQRSGKLPTEK